MPTATSSSTIPEEPPSASTPKLHLHYVTVSGDSTPRRPNLINNLLDLSTKARLGGRRGIKRKALLYAGPDIDDVEQDIMVNNNQILFLEFFGIRHDLDRSSFHLEPKIVDLKGHS